MKSFTDVKRELNNVREEINVLDTEMHDINKRLSANRHDRWVAKLAAAKQGDASPAPVEFDSLETELCKLSDKIEHNKIKRSVLENNARLALFEESKDAIVEVLTKYQGKPLGDRTREKIGAEITTLSGYRTYISRDWRSTYLRIYDNDQDINISVCPKYPLNGITNDSNKIIAVPAEKLSVCYVNKTFIDDAGVQAIAIAGLKSEAVKAAAKYNAIVDSYNTMTCDGVEPLKRLYI